MEEPKRVPLLTAMLAALAASGDHPDDTDEIRQHKRFELPVLLLVDVPLQTLGLVSSLYGDAPIVSFVLGGCVSLSLGGFVLVVLTKRFFGVVRNLQMALRLIVPFSFTYFLGGLDKSGFALAIPMVAPLFARARFSRRAALAWLWITAALLVVVILAPKPPSAGLPRDLRVMLELVVLLVVTIIAYGRTSYFVNEIERERRRAQELLENILPRPIAARLQRDGRSRIAEQFEGASVLFADLVGFTVLSTKVPPADLVEMLDGIFRKFDEFADRYGVEKIKTIGDCYMAAAGIPVARPDHAEALVSMALDVQAWAERELAPQGLSFRIGVHSGPVVAGVIGTKKFSYDVWGDVVNTASRMESHGAPGTIHVSEQTHALVAARFVCEARGALQVKGKGELRTYFVKGRRPDESSGAAAVASGP